ncbi:MAG: thioredoxin-disulfide reductase [Candidatus Buchananbacteria bacterium RIFCSPHIGHO2_01_FULL_39_14]|uniref:Thioredoxin reductase n=2 Tax=Candidatus Buchananiibacteriota TaxID=1817903 RepID=A0A1G1YSL7_9BACT|nr:MAG: thioredoxin-disulfide reductase [Candidatus Buchananbacteria bacterium RIFCSPHIGHO2_01_FULL_39_14]OGY48466.1 MAG: thioredoxin-disulfide reductase [Candidatus Buchananbacteria bacterium RIFCSPHIGHO2_02_FULL_39_17]OGY55294.1 MAG: thioredoxin-disulfide reductase [Candidatus Buchananbacteria bacterium RIFCSPLOWO2_01_FULL_40_23b]
MARQKNEVIIIGGGIAAHTAALYAARAELKPIVLQAASPDQLSLTTVVENFPGFPEGILGTQLVENAKKQAQKFGAQYVLAQADSFDIKKDYFEIVAGKEVYQALTVIIATGAAARRLDVPGEDKYFGRGVSTCATCDAAFYRDREAVVVGGGDSAMEETLALYKFAKKVTIIHRKNEFKASKIMQERVFSLKDKIEIIWGTEITEVLGDGQFVTGLKLKNIKTDEMSEIKTNGLFLAIGHIPNTKIFINKIQLDELGYIVTDKKSHINVNGVFAAGDCQDHIFRQAITSAGSGCQAAMEAERYIEKLKADGKV